MVDRFRPITLSDSKSLTRQEQQAGRLVYALDTCIVTEARTYRVTGTSLAGEALARKLGVQTVDAHGELYWPRHPLVAWLLAWGK